MSDTCEMPFQACTRESPALDTADSLIEFIRNAGDVNCESDVPDEVWRHFDAITECAASATASHVVLPANRRFGYYALQLSLANVDALRDAYVGDALDKQRVAIMTRKFVNALHMCASRAIDELVARHAIVSAYYASGDFILVTRAENGESRDWVLTMVTSWMAGCITHLLQTACGEYVGNATVTGRAIEFETAEHAFQTVLAAAHRKTSGQFELFTSKGRRISGDSCHTSLVDMYIRGAI